MRPLKVCIKGCTFLKHLFYDHNKTLNTFFEFKLKRDSLLNTFKGKTFTSAPVSSLNDTFISSIINVLPHSYSCGLRVNTDLIKTSDSFINSCKGLSSSSTAFNVLTLQALAKWFNCLHLRHTLPQAGQLLYVIFVKHFENNFSWEFL